MPRITSLLFVLLVSAPFLACSGTDSDRNGGNDDGTGNGTDPQDTVDGPLDCARLEGANCYNQMIVGLSCAPPEGERGVLSADRTSCAYADGSTVKFLVPAPTSVDDVSWHFALEKDGVRCFEYEGGGEDGKSKYVSGADTVRIEASVRSGMSLYCPDGKHYFTENALSVLDCATTFGSSYSASANDVMFSFFGLAGAGTDDRKMFDCSVAP